jgi:short-subunit dehydrogenase involved in D-alanine esterification of teichoic acids
VRDTRIGTSAVSMPAHHNGNVVLITGGSDGIGLAIARTMAAAGDEVVVCGRDEQRLTQHKMRYWACTRFVAMSPTNPT